MSWHKEDWAAAGNKVKAFLEAHPVGVYITIAFILGFITGAML